ncbi:MAG: hypothetical protein ACYCZW_00385 [Minisyncoccota bacterium]
MANSLILAVLLQRYQGGMLNQFSKWWSIKNTLPAHTDLIALVSFGATSTRMTYGLLSVVSIGRNLKRHYPTAKVVFGEFTENKVHGLEYDLKTQVFPNAVYCGEVISTIEEGEYWYYATQNTNPKNIVIVTDEMHSRSAWRVSNRVWNGLWYERLWKWIMVKPMVKIHIKTFPTCFAIDSENPMAALRNQWLWTRNNILRELFLMFMPFGYTIMKELNIHQPVAK